MSTEFENMNAQIKKMRPIDADNEPTEKKLQEEERFLSDIFSSVQDGISVLDHDLNILRVNMTMEKWYKHAMPLVGKKCYEAYHGRHEPCNLCPTIRTLESNKAAIEVVPKRGPGGTIIGWLDLYSFPLIDQSTGRTKGVIEYVRDITERKHAEDELRKSEAKNRLLLKSIQLPVLALKQDLTIFYCNDSYARFVGKKVSELEGKNLTELFPDFKDTKSYQAYLDVLESGRSQEVEGIMRDQVMHAWVYRTPEGILAVAEDVTERIKAEQELKMSYEKLHRTMEQTINALSLTLGKRDPYTSSHQQRVTELACAIGKEMGLPENQISGLRVAGILHDIGKIYVPSEILSKPTKLSPAEFGIIKTHPKTGYDILAAIEFPWPIAKIVLQHHEKLNGSGYPFGVKDQDILLEAKIIGVADVIEAMSSHRPYRPALGLDVALNDIIENKGTLYDVAVVDACVNLIRNKGYILK